MNIRKITSRTVVAGMTTALAAGALVGVTGTAANAVTNTTTYTCAMTTPFATPIGTADLMVDTPVVPAEGTAGQSFPGGLLAFTAALTINDPATAGMLIGYGVDGGYTDDYAANVGPSDIGAPMTFEAPTLNEGGTATMLGGGANTPFSLPGAGTYDIGLPAEFNFVATSGGTSLAVINCVVAEPGSLGEIKLTKGPSALKATSKRGKVNVTVDRTFDDVAPGGKVTATLGKKTWTEKLVKKAKTSKAVFALPKSAKGKKVTISYKGDKFTSAAKSIKVLVK
jgi:hypothetical protein